MKIIRILILMLILLLNMPYGYTQQQNDDYLASYNKGQYKQALGLISKRLKTIYDKSIDKKINTKAYVLEKDRPDNESLDKYYENKRLFSNRKAHGFLIKEDNELSQLHLYAGRCHFQLKNNAYALNHYIQSLRYKKLEKTDHIVFFEISQIYKKIYLLYKGSSALTLGLPQVYKDNYQNNRWIANSEETSAYNAYLDALETAYSLSPETYTYSLELGRELYYANQQRNAIFHLERYTELDNNASPGLYIMLGNLHEQIGEYIKAEKYYALFSNKLKNYTGTPKLTYPSGKEIQPGYINFSLGFIAYKHTGNHQLAVEAFKSALKQLPDNEIYRKSKAYEYMGDIAVSDLRYSDSISYYLETINYQNKIIEDVDRKKLEIQKIDKEISELKAVLLNQTDPDKFTEYQRKQQGKGSLETDLHRLLGEYKKMSPGKIRWNIAGSFEHIEKYKAAIKYYKEAVSFGFRSKQARDKIEKLELKIIRGW